jgi:hypothetical protein
VAARVDHALAQTSTTFFAFIVTLDNSADIQDHRFILNGAFESTSTRKETDRAHLKSF